MLIGQRPSRSRPRKGTLKNVDTSGKHKARPRGPQVSVVVPVYHQVEHICDSIRRISHALKRAFERWEIVVVCDGDYETYKQALKCQASNIHIVGYSENQGKGYALRFGAGMCTGELVTFIDADGELDPEEISRMAQLQALYDADIVVGSKRHPLSKVSYPLMRRFQSLCYQLLVRCLFRVNVRDTQTGIKLLRRKVAVAVLPLLLVKRFAFDVELLVVARQMGFRRVIEAPVTLDYKFSSTTNLKAVLRVLIDTLAIFYRLYIRRTYQKRMHEFSAYDVVRISDELVEQTPSKV